MFVPSSYSDHRGEAHAMSDSLILIAGMIAAVLVYAVASAGSAKAKSELVVRVATACIAVGAAFIVGFGAALAFL